MYIVRMCSRGRVLKNSPFSCCSGLTNISPSYSSAASSSSPQFEHSPHPKPQHIQIPLERLDGDHEESNGEHFTTDSPSKTPHKEHNWVTEAHPISKIRHMVLAEKHTSPQLQAALDELHFHQHAFFEKANARYEREKTAVIESAECVTRGEMDDRISSFEAEYQSRYGKEFRDFERENRRLIWKVCGESVKLWNRTALFFGLFGLSGVVFGVSYVR